MSARESDHGAAAVEFALILPLILTLVCGIIDFGRFLNAQITVTQAAREGVRVAALGRPDLAPGRVADAGSPLSVNGVVTTECPASPTATSRAVVDASHTFTFVTPIGSMTGVFGGVGTGGTRAITARGVMRCGA